MVRLFIIASVFFSCEAMSADIEVFYSSLSGQSVTGEQIAGHTITYGDLDAGKIAQQLINNQVAGTKQEALRKFSALQNRSDGRELVEDVTSGYQIVGRAFQLGLTKLPAVAFNGSHVVYGTTDVRVALREYVAREK